MIQVRGLAVANGDGRLARREGGVLFVPAWDDGADALLAAFRAAASDDIMEVVPAFVVDNDFGVPPFACVTWAPRVTILVFGDLEVRTDHPALAMLSGAGSQTWVEHSLRGAVEHVVVTVDPPDDDVAPSDLEGGVVPSAGFALGLAVAVDQSSTGGLDTDAAAGEGGKATAPVDDSGWDAQGGGMDAGDVDDQDAKGGGPQEAEGTGPDGDDSDGQGRPLVQAVRCEDGHLTGAGSTACRVCGTPVSASAAVSIVPRPSLGVLALDDGRLFELDRNYRIGRKPESDEHATAARVEGEKVSREHVEVLLREWDVLVRDCDSTNGTWVASNAQARFRRVEPDVPVRIEPGSVIRIDRRTMTYVVQQG